MENAIYKRQVTKNALSKRVVDDEQINRLFKRNDLHELYSTSDIGTNCNKAYAAAPNDHILAELLTKYENIIHNYHCHDSLLINNEDENLSLEERQSAWTEFESERSQRKKSQNSLRFPCLQIGIKYVNISIKNLFNTFFSLKI